MLSGFFRLFPEVTAGLTDAAFSYIIFKATGSGSSYSEGFYK